ncbi:MAG: response regulator transcription factor [Myxococcota bacterium]|nr:response regulator transcription factor [Myxococcota bacterium]
MSRILVVEDAETLGLSLELSLQNEGFEVVWAKTLKDATQQLVTKAPDLIILDLGLPDGDGLQLCDRLREEQHIMPILVLTARDSLMARVEGLSAGADDYMTKPFELPELLARVHALLRRQGWHGRGDSLQVGCLQIDFKRRRALRDGRAANMTELEFKLLHYLVRNSERIITREELLTEVWEQSAQTRTRTVDVFMSRLRQLIESNPTHPTWLRNIRGVGYQLTRPDGQSRGDTAPSKK